MTNNVKATATANVDEHGVASTSNITFNEQLVPGHTYAVNAKYQQNDNYLQGVGVGELEILKIPTTTTITGSNSISYGDSVTLTVVVKENRNNSNLSRGTITVYDGNQVIQSNYAVTGQSTSISFIPQTTGTHDIYAVYNDTGVEYNNSTSNHVNITVNKLNSTITVNNSLTMYFGDTATISGTLKQGNNNLSGQSVSLIDYDDTVLQTVTTAQDGTFSFNYSPQNWNIHNHNLKIQYNGTNTINSSTKTIPVTLQRHDVTISLPQNMEGYTNDEVDITATLVDEQGNPVTSGTIEWLVTKVEEYDIRMNPEYVSSGSQYINWYLESDDFTSSELYNLLHGNVSSVVNQGGTANFIGSIIKNDNDDTVFFTTYRYNGTLNEEAIWMYDSGDAIYTFTYTPGGT